MSNRVKLVQQALEAHRRALRTATDKDQVRRQIAAAEKRLAAEKAAAGV